MLEIAAISFHVAQLGPAHRRGDNALIYVLVQIVFGLPVQAAVLVISFVATRLFARWRAR